MGSKNEKVRCMTIVTMVVIISFACLGFSSLNYTYSSERATDGPDPSGEVFPSSSSSGIEQTKGGLASSPWPMFRHNLNHTGLSPYDTYWNPGNLIWSFPTDNWVSSSPAIGTDGTIYVGGTRNIPGSLSRLFAINPDGSQKWSATIGEFIGLVYSSPAIDSNGTVYIGSLDTNLYAIYSNGTRKWNFTTGGMINSSPAIGPDGTIYFGSQDGNLYALYPNGTKKWNFLTGAVVSSSPAIGTDGTIYFGSYNYKVYALYPNGTEKWNFTTGHSVSSSPAIGSDGTIYVGSHDRNFYAINPNGTKKWSFITGEFVSTSPAIEPDGTIYIASQDYKVYAINPNGTQKWNFTTGYRISSSPSVDPNGMIYIGSWDNRLYALYPDGMQKWNFTTGDRVASSPTIGPTGTIYVGSEDHNLYAIGVSSLKNLTVTVTADPPTVFSGNESTITVNVANDTDPVENAEVYLASSCGSLLPINGTTDADGNLTSTFTAPVVAAQTICRITVQTTKPGYHNGFGDVNVTVIPLPTLLVTVDADPSTILSGQTSTITVHVTDGTNPVQGVDVNLTSDCGGTFSPQNGTSDVNGNLTITFTAPTVIVQTICNITAQGNKTGYNGGSGYVAITVDPIPSLVVTVIASPTTVVSGQTSTITVHVTDGTNPVQDVTIDLASDNGGTFNPQSGTTDVNGNLTSTFTAPSVSTQTICNITAQAVKTGYNDGFGFVEITVEVMTTPSLVVTVSADPNTVLSGETSTITVHVTDGSNPVQDATVTLVSNNGGSFNPASGTTDTNGDFTSVFTAPGVTMRMNCRITADATKAGYYDDSESTDVTVDLIQPTPPPPAQPNYKPLIALAFALVLLIIGSFISAKRPLRLTENNRKNKIYTWLIVVLPFIIAEALTGVISLVTGLLSVPPFNDAGMIVDLTILVLGLIIFIIVFKKGRKVTGPTNHTS